MTTEFSSAINFIKSLEKIERLSGVQMKLQDYTKFIKSFLDKRKIKASDTAIKAFMSKRYLYQDVLEDMKKKEFLENMRILLDDILKSYESRAKKSARKIALRDIDVRPVLKEKKCKLPPICKFKQK